MTAALNVCAAYTQRPFRTPQRPVPGRRSTLCAAWTARMFCRFKSRLLKQLHPALLRGGQCGLSSFFVLAPFLPQHRRRKERPLCKLRQNGPQRALLWKSPLSPQQRPTSPPPAEDTSPLPLCRLARRPMLCKSRPAPRPKPPRPNTPAGRKPAPRAGARV